VFINICMLAHVPTTYLYEMSCETSALGPHEARGNTFYSLSACIEVLRRSTEYCERWRDEDNATMTRLLDPPDDVCPSIGLSFYNAITQYVTITALTILVVTLHIDLRHDLRSHGADAVVTNVIVDVMAGEDEAAAEAAAKAAAEAQAAAAAKAKAAAEAQAAAEAKAAAEAQATQALQRVREAKAAQEAADKAAADRVEANRLFAVQQAAEAAEVAERAAAAGAECELFCVNIPLPVHGGEKFVWTVDDRLMQFVAPEGMRAGQEHEYELTAHQLAAAPKLEKFGLLIPLPVPGGQSFVWTVDDKLMEFQAPEGMAVGEEYEFEFTELELLSAPSVDAPLEITPPDQDGSPSDGAKTTQNPSKRSVWKVLGKKGKEGTPKASRTVRTATSPYDPELDPDNKRGSTRRQLSFARRVASGFRL
jgi:hypothetical protein